MSINATFIGGSKDGDIETFPYRNRLEVQIVKYIGPDQNEDGTWPEHPSGNYDNWYVPAELEVYTPEHVKGRDYNYVFRGSR